MIKSIKISIITLSSILFINACTENELAGTATTENVIELQAEAVASTNAVGKITYFDESINPSVHPEQSAIIDLSAPELKVKNSKNWLLQIENTDVIPAEVFWFYGTPETVEIPPVVLSPSLTAIYEFDIKYNTGEYYLGIHGTDRLELIDENARALFYQVYALDEYPIYMLKKLSTQEYLQITDFTIGSLTYD